MVAPHLDPSESHPFSRADWPKFKTLHSSMESINTFQTMRARMRSFAESLTPAQLLEVPSGFNNNILWNLGHLAVTQQLLCYKLAGLALPIDEKFVALFGKDSSPASWTESPDPSEVLPLLTELAERYAADHSAGIFKTFESYMTMVGVELTGQQQAFQFNQMHDGIHFGYAMAQRRALRKS